MFQQPRKSALLVDFDNVIAAYGRPLLDHIKNWVLWLEHGQFDPLGVRRKFIVKRVYWNSENDTHRQAFHKNRFDIHLCRAIRKEKASSADFDITIQAVQLHHEHRDLKEFIILSFDTDFSSVLLHLQLAQRTGVGMIDADKLDNVKDTATSKYMRLLDLSIEKEEFRAAFAYEPAKRGRVVVKPPPQLVSAPAAPAPLPREPKRPAAPRIATAKFDYSAAADIIAEAAEQNGLVYVGRDRIRTLIKDVPGFISPAGWPWGGGSYRKALNEFVRAQPDKFYLERSANNSGVVLAYRGRDKSPDAAQQQTPAA